MINNNSKTHIIQSQNIVNNKVSTYGSIINEMEKTESQPEKFIHFLGHAFTNLEDICKIKIISNYINNSLHFCINDVQIYSIFCNKKISYIFEKYLNNDHTVNLSMLNESIIHDITSKFNAVENDHAKKIQNLYHSHTNKIYYQKSNEILLLRKLHKIMVKFGEVIKNSKTAIKANYKTNSLEAKQKTEEEIACKKHLDEISDLGGKSKLLSCIEYGYADCGNQAEILWCMLKEDKTTLALNHHVCYIRDSDHGFVVIGDDINKNSSIVLDTWIKYRKSTTGNIKQRGFLGNVGSYKQYLINNIDHKYIKQPDGSLHIFDEQKIDMPDNDINEINNAINLVVAKLGFSNIHSE